MMFMEVSVDPMPAKKEKKEINLTTMDQEETKKLLSKYSYIYRKSLIIIINALGLIWPTSMSFVMGINYWTWGLVILPYIFLTLAYNTYAILLAKYFWRKRRTQPFAELLFAFLILLPAFLIWHNYFRPYA